MSGFLAPLLIIAMLATLSVLFFGIFTMARGGEFNQKYSNKIMRARVILQGLALLVFAFLMLVAGHG
ncbi:MAG: twin transmembrane helix small protein [Pseudomonadota bacterium]|nr:twin transmembrane helix small protein [Pseudomonadota bacterium]